MQLFLEYDLGLLAGFKERVPYDLYQNYRSG